MDNDVMGSERNSGAPRGHLVGKPYDPKNIKDPAEVDSSRVSWDPEYRKKVMEALKRLAEKDSSKA